MIEERVPLAPLTSFRLGGPARYLARVSSAEEARDALRFTREEGLDLRILGGGTNLLVADEGVDALVLKPEGGEFKALTVNDSAVFAGCALPATRLVSAAAEAGLTGLEMLAGLPGTVGGAIQTEAGGSAGTIMDRFAGARLADVADEAAWLERGELPFEIREGRFAGYLVLEAKFELGPDDPERVRRGTREWLERRRSTQPVAERSAGCAFRNPPAPADPAGKIIDELGLKGTAVGGAVVSEMHANYIVARGGATASDVLSLIDLIRGRVLDDRGIELDLEIEVWR